MMSFILNSKDVNRDSYVWNALAGMLNSVQLPILLFLVARGTDGVSDSAILVIAYAIANLMMMVGKYGVRNYHVTDVNNEHTFSDYLYSRKITVFVMIIASVIYVLVNSYDMNKLIIVLLICLMKGFDSYEDVYHSQLQKQGRLDIAGKILSIRLILYFVIFFCSYIIFDDLLITSIVSVLISVGFGCVVNYVVWKQLEIEKGQFNYESVKNVFKECFPLFLCSFLIMYVANAPKYTVDKYYNLDIQAAFNYVFMPVFVIALFGNFIFQPIQAKASVVYKDKKYEEFNKLISRGTLAVAIITLIITMLGGIIGIPILSFVFNYNLTDYKIELILLLITGGGLALINMLNIFISLIRYQKYMIVVYGIIAVVTKVVGDLIGKNHTILSLVIFYCIAVFVLMFGLFFVLHRGMKKDCKDLSVKEA